MNIQSAQFICSSSKLSQCPKTDMPEYAFIGRSNVGKSSLINMLTSKKGLAKVSSTPGKTKLINHFLINSSWYLADLPGYGYAKLSKKSLAKFSVLITDYVSQRENLTMLFVLVDSRLEPQKIDTDFINLLGEHGIPFGIIFTKVDKLTKRELAANIKHYKQHLFSFWDQLPPIFLTSSESSQGKEDVLSYINEVNQQLS